MLILCYQGVENNIQHLCWMQTCLHPDMARKPMYPSTACYLESLVPSLPLSLLFSTVFYFVLEYSFGLDGKKSACNVRDLGLIPGLGKYPGERNGYPLQFPCLENSMDKGACCIASVVSDSVRSHRWQPTRLPIPGILQARTLEWVAISISNA